MRERRVPGQGVPLCLCEWGHDTKPAILCLHGTRDHGGSWEAVAEALVEEGHRVVAPDLRGHGLSDHVAPAEGYHLRDFVADLDAVLHELGPAPVALVAHSLGSIVATVYAAAHPHRVGRLILVEPPLPPSFRAKVPATGVAAGPGARQALYRHAAMADLDVAVARLCEVTPGMPVEAAKRMAMRLTRACDGGIVWRWDARLNAPHHVLLEGLTSEQYLELMARVDVPVTIAYGDRSGWITQRDRELVHAALPGATVRIVEGGHNLHLEAAPDIAQIVAEAVRSEQVSHGSGRASRSSLQAR